jgi:hypothetical protein
MDEHTQELIDKLIVLEKDYMREDASYAKECGREHLTTEDEINTYLHDMYSNMPKQELINLYNTNLV